jgi:hypothetical protein
VWLCRVLLSRPFRGALTTPVRHCQTAQDLHDCSTTLTFLDLRRYAERSF